MSKYFFLVELRAQSAPVTSLFMLDCGKLHQPHPQSDVKIKSGDTAARCSPSLKEDERYKVSLPCSMTSQESIVGVNLNDRC